MIAAREARGLDRAAAAKLAKVPLRFAEMLEEGKYSLVADPAYLVPYLRRYAAALDISPDALVIAFHQENEIAERMAPLPNVLEMPVGPSYRRRLQRFAMVAAFLGGVVLTFALLSMTSAKPVFSFGGWRLPFDGWLASLPFGRKIDAAASPSVVAERTASVPAPVNVAQEAPANQVPKREERAPQPAAPPRAPVVVAVAPTPAMTAVPMATLAVVAVAPTAAPRVLPTATPATRVRAVATETPLSVARVALPGAPARASAAPTPATRGYRLELTGTARQVWVWISVDGGRRRAVEIRRGSRVQFDATREFVLSLDDAGGVDATLNGKPLPPLGNAGEARRNLRFPDG